MNNQFEFGRNNVHEFQSYDMDIPVDYDNEDTDFLCVECAGFFQVNNDDEITFFEIDEDVSVLLDPTEYDDHTRLPTLHETRQIESYVKRKVQDWLESNEPTEEMVYI